MATNLDNGRRLARRRWAGWSFWFMFATSVALVGKFLTAEDPKVAAEAIIIFLGPLGMLFGFFTTIVLSYLGISFAERLKS